LSRGVSNSESLRSLVTFSRVELMMMNELLKTFEMKGVRKILYEGRLVEIIIDDPPRIVVQIGQTSASIIAETGDVRQ
jgi:hypothetical protein